MSQSNSDKVAKVGEDIGGRVKGLFQSVHGVGEAIRGNMNDVIDKSAEGVVGRDKQQGVYKDSEHDHRGTANDGIAELKTGIDNVTGKGHGKAFVPAAGKKAPAEVDSD